MSPRWDLWVDFARVDPDGLTHAHTRDLMPDAEIQPGRHIVVGDDDADPAVASVVSVDPSGGVLLRVLPAAAEGHLELLDGSLPDATRDGGEPGGTAGATV
jgi:hypothetical protein